MAIINTEVLGIVIDQDRVYSVMNDAWKQGHTGSYAERYYRMLELKENPCEYYVFEKDAVVKKIQNFISVLKEQEWNSDNSSLIKKALGNKDLEEHIYSMFIHAKSGDIDLETWTKPVIDTDGM